MTPAHAELADELEKIELRLLHGDQHDCADSNTIGRAVHFLRSPAIPAAGEVREALKRLVKCMDEIHEHPKFKSVWTINQIHAGPYDGPTYVAELNEAKRVLALPQSKDARPLPGEAGREGIARTIATELGVTFDLNEAPAVGEIADRSDCLRIADAILALRSPSVNGAGAIKRAKDALYNIAKMHGYKLNGVELNAASQ